MASGTFQREISFDGPDVNPQDTLRLSNQLAAVLSIMQDHHWRTLEEIQSELLKLRIAATTQGVSARLRDLRKPRFGSHEVDRRRRTQAVWEYRLVR
jgi:hypothetical protein